METETTEKDNNSDKSPKIGNQILGQLAALGMGSMVVGINAEHGPLLASIAGVKQYVYSAVIAVLLIDAQDKVYDHLKKTDKESLRPAILSIVIPSLSTVLATLAVHSLKGTPETIKSTIPTAILAPIGYTILHVRKVLKESNRQLYG
jgi:hypothetical protein